VKSACDEKDRPITNFQPGENNHYRWIRNPLTDEDDLWGLCTHDSTAFFSALGQQSHSLERLDYAQQRRTWYSAISPDCPGLSNFKKLQHISMIGNCIPFESALQDARTAPPNLSIYRLKEDIFPRQRLDPHEVEGRYKDSFRWLLKTARAIPSLQNIDLVTDHRFVPNAASKAMAIKAAGREFEWYEKHLRVYRFARYPNFPPYLDGEEGEVETLLFESETDCFHQWDQSIGLDEEEESGMDSDDSPDDESDVETRQEDGRSSSEDSD
jgi:hypothetical protein